MKREPKMAVCQNCGAEMAASAKTCPKCGAKNKKPIYKRPWFIAVVVIVIIGVIGGAAGGGGDSEQPQNDGGTVVSGNTGKENEPQTPEITYTSYEVSELVNDLEGNAMKAADKYKGQYVELTGRLSNIDSSGKYIDIDPTDREFCLTGVQCYLKTEEQKATVMDLSIGDTVVVKGKITEVGEVMGYSLNIDEIVK